MFFVGTGCEQCHRPVIGVVAVPEKTKRPDLEGQSVLPWYNSGQVSFGSRHEPRALAREHAMSTRTTECILAYQDVHRKSHSAFPTGTHLCPAPLKP